MATSSTEICNLALLRMGSPRINDIDEDSPNARYCNQIYNQMLDETLSIGPERGWRFARARLGSVGVESTEPDFEYEYQYALPTNMIKLISVMVDGLEITDWIREGDYILTNKEADEVDFKYVQRITDVSKFPPYFVEVLAMKIAIGLTYRISQDLKKVADLKDELIHYTIPKAIANDNREGYVQESSSSWQDIGRTLTTLE